MNVLETVKSILGINAMLGRLPDAPDEVVALFEYASPPPEQYFGSTAYAHNVQVRARAAGQAAAYALALDAQSKLNRYDDDLVSILQVSAILDIGMDEKNRREYTVNFTVYMKEE